MTTLWSGRFDTAPDAAAFEFGASFRFDRRLFEDDVTGSLAWARALAAAGVLTPEEARADRSGARRDPRAGPGRSGLRRRRRRGRAQLRRAAARRARSATPAGGCTPDARATSRCRSICGCTCGAAFRCCSRRSPASSTRWPAQASAAGDALMPAFTHFRPAQPVLVAHFFLAHVAPLRRDYERLDGGARRSRRAAARLGRRRRHELRDRRRRARTRSRLLPRRRQQHRRLVRSRLRRDVPLRLRADDGASQPAGGGSHHPLRRRAPVSSSCPTRSAPAAA